MEFGQTPGQGRNTPAEIARELETFYLAETPQETSLRIFILKRDLSLMKDLARLVEPLSVEALGQAAAAFVAGEAVAAQIVSRAYKNLELSEVLTQIDKMMGLSDRLEYIKNIQDHEAGEFWYRIRENASIIMDAGRRGYSELPSEYEGILKEIADKVVPYRAHQNAFYAGVGLIHGAAVQAHNEKELAAMQRRIDENPGGMDWDAALRKLTRPS